MRFAKRDLTGQTFGRLKVLTADSKDRYGRFRWICICDCGARLTVQGGNLTSGNTTSCGGHGRGQVRTDLTGRRFGRLVAIAVDENASNKNIGTSCGCRVIEMGRARLLRMHALGTWASCGAQHILVGNQN